MNNFILRALAKLSFDLCVLRWTRTKKIRWKLAQKKKYTNLIVLFGNYCCFRTREKFSLNFCFKIDFLPFASDTQRIQRKYSWSDFCAPDKLYKKYRLRSILNPNPKGMHLISFCWFQVNWEFGLFQYVLTLIKNNLMKIRIIHTQTTWNQIIFSIFKLFRPPFWRWQWIPNTGRPQY